MHFGSVCTGVGGLDLGLELAGMRVAWQCEADEKCRRVLARHWPGVPCHPDLQSLHADADPGKRRGRGRAVRGARDIRRPASADGQQGAFGPVGLFCGGFPCQDLSPAGRRAGLAGERSALFFDLARVASVVLGPGGWLLIENVPGLLSSHRGRDFAVVLATLAELGFHDLAWRVLDSRHFGVPQRRQRVFILARRSTGRCAAEVLLEPESGGGDHQAGGKAGARVASTLSHGSSRPGVSAPGRRQEDAANVVNALDTNAGGADNNSAQAGHIVGALTRRDGKGPNSGCDNGQIVNALGSVHRGVPNAEEVAQSQIVAAPLTAGGHDSSEDGTGRQTFVPVEVGTLRRSSSAIGLDCPERYPLVSGTLRSNPRNNSNGGTEAAALVEAADPHGEGAPPGLPGRLDDPVRPLACPAEPRPDGPREAQMGNAVTVPVAYWIGQRILEHERRQLAA